MKAHLEPDLARDIKNNKKNFLKYAGDKRKTRENVSLLLSVSRDLETQDIVKAEVLNTFFTSVSTSKTGLQQFQAMDTNGKVWNKKMNSWWKCGQEIPRSLMVCTHKC